MHTTAVAEQTIAVADLGGTHARFAFARVAPDVAPAMGPELVLKAADHPDFVDAWRAFLAAEGRAAPRHVVLAVACSARGEEIRFANNPWRLQRSRLAAALGVETVEIINDFGAVGHAVAALGRDNFASGDFAPLFGRVGAPESFRPRVVSVIGAGTGLGVALTLFHPQGHGVVETEGGHIGFAPRDEFETALAARVAKKFGRVSAERLISGPGLAEIFEQLSGRATAPDDLPALWRGAIAGEDRLARAALEKFCALFAGFCGDAALIHGAEAVVLAGGLAPRIKHWLSGPLFAENFIAKGRYRELIAATPVYLLTHPQPGLLGAARAFAGGGQRRG